MYSQLESIITAAWDVLKNAPKAQIEGLSFSFHYPRFIIMSNILAASNCKPHLTFKAPDFYVTPHSPFDVSFGSLLTILDNICRAPSKPKCWHGECTSWAKSRSSHQNALIALCFRRFYTLKRRWFCGSLDTYEEILPKRFGKRCRNFWPWA